jgi:hypothetical protein
MTAAQRYERHRQFAEAVAGGALVAVGHELWIAVGKVLR